MPGLLECPVLVPRLPEELLGLIAPMSISNAEVHFLGSSFRSLMPGKLFEG